MKILTLLTLLFCSAQLIGQDVKTFPKVDSRTGQSEAVQDVRAQQAALVLDAANLQVNENPVTGTKVEASSIDGANSEMHEKARQLSAQYAHLGFKAVVTIADGKQYIELKPLPVSRGMDPSKN